MKEKETNEMICENGNSPHLASFTTCGSVQLRILALETFLSFSFEPLASI